MQTPAPVEYERATSIAHALQLMERLGPEARVIAGGHSLLPMMRLRLAQPDTVIDINDLTELAGIRVEGNHLVLGAMTRHADVLASAVVGEHYSIFHDAERVIADPVVRNRGTVGGSLCQADPAEDLSAVAAALKAMLTLRSSKGERTVEAREFVQGPYETLLGPAEILTAIKVPIRAGAGSAYEKVERRAGDWAIAAAGSFVVLDNGAITDVGIGVAAVGAPHQCAPQAEEFLVGKEPTDDNLSQAARLTAEACEPRADQRGPVEYKRHLAGELTRRALRRSVARATGSE
jgi:carbon-monoxide dehydrogenase medium subunit